MRRVGIFAGSFDPVHDGHVAFALAALQTADLDEVIFLPERRPRGKQNVTSLEHRLAMLREAIAGYSKLQVMDLPQDQFTVAETLPALRRRLPSAELTLLMGTDVAKHIHLWPDADELLKTTQLIIGVREGDQPPANLNATIIPTDRAHIAASHVRSGASTDVAPGVKTYIKQHGLYRV